MKRLGQIPAITAKIKSASSKTIKMLHVFIFGNEGNKNNRKRLMEFQGFKFLDESDELAAKMRQASQYLAVGDLVSICNILAMDYTGTKQEVISRICSGLMDLDQLAREAEEDDNEHGDDDEDEKIKGQDDEQGGEKYQPRERIPEQVIREQVVLQPQHFSLSYRDVENTIRTFDGTDVYPVERWIDDFEDTASFWLEQYTKIGIRQTNTDGARKTICPERARFEHVARIKGSIASGIRYQG